MGRGVAQVERVAGMGGWEARNKSRWFEFRERRAYPSLMMHLWRRRAEALFCMVRPFCLISFSCCLRQNKPRNIKLCALDRRGDYLPHVITRTRLYHRNNIFRTTTFLGGEVKHSPHAAGLAAGRCTSQLCCPICTLAPCCTTGPNAHAASLLPVLTQFLESSLFCLSCHIISCLPTYLQGPLKYGDPDMPSSTEIGLVHVPSKAEVLSQRITLVAATISQSLLVATFQPTTRFVDVVV